MRRYLSFFRIRFLNGLQYRTAAYAGIATQFAWGFMSLLMFSAFYKTKPEAFPMEFSQVSSYIWLQQAFLALYMVWFLETDIFSAISNGNIAYELCRPINLYNMWYAKNLASRFSKAVLRCLPILLIAFFLPKPYGLSLPGNITTLLAFLLSMSLGVLVVIGICMLIYIATFYTLSPMGVRIVAISFIDFLSGAVIPLPFLPDKIRFVLQLLPFASMQDIPFRVYSGHITGSDRVIGILLQLFWLVFLITLGKLFMKNALKKIVVQGG